MLRSLVPGWPAPAAMPEVLAAGRDCQCHTISARLRTSAAIMAAAAAFAGSVSMSDASAVARIAKDRIMAMAP
ncbi:hypothetical protein D3C87_1961910 [compost metagenome]